MNIGARTFAAFKALLLFLRSLRLPLSKWVVLISLCSLPLKVFAQELQPRLTVFPPDRYEGHSQVFSAHPLSKGKMAFGTFKHLLIYDGEEMSKVKIGPGKYVLDMDRDYKGRLFVGGIRAMGMLFPDSLGNLTYRSLTPLLPDTLGDLGKIWEVVCTGKGSTYFRTKEQIFHFDGDSIHPIFPGESFFGLHLAGDELTVQDVNTGIYRIEGDQKNLLSGSKEFVSGKEIFEVIANKAGNGARTFFTRMEGLFRYDPKKDSFHSLTRRGNGPQRSSRGKNRSPKGGWRSARIHTACELNPSKNPFGAAYAVGTELKGIYLLSRDSRVLYRIGSDEGLPSEYIWDLVPTSGGDIWATTENGIALIHTGLPFTFGRKGKDFKGAVRDVERSPVEGGPLFLSTSQGAWVKNPKRKGFRYLQGSKGKLNNMLAWPSDPSKLNAPPSRTLVAGGHSGILSIAYGADKQVSVDTLFHHHIRDIVHLPQKSEQRHAVLAGGRSGLYVLRSKRILGGDPPEALLKIPDIRAVASVGVTLNERGDSLRLWGATPSKGVDLLKITVDTGMNEYRITRYDTTDGLPGGQVWVFEDPEGKGVLFGTKEGSYAFKNGSFSPSCRYHQIFCDGSRQLWRLSKGVEEEVWIGDAEGSRVKHLIPDGEGYRVDSLPFRNLDIGIIREIHPEEGIAWIGADQGLAQYDPDVKNETDRAWDCSIRRVLGSGDSLLFGGTFFRDGDGHPSRSDDHHGKAGQNEDRSSRPAVDGLALSRVPLDSQPDGMTPTLPYSRNRMKFSFAASFTDKQEAVKYSYKLLGFDSTWSKWTQELQKEYTNLPEGNYTFKVKARNIYLHESSTAKYRFTILPPWYRTWTAYSGYSLAGIGLIWLIVWLNSRRLVAQKQRLEEIVSKRTKEIQEEKAKVEEAHKEITQSIDYAQKIQFALLQSEENVSSHLPEHFILFKPQSQVSGDFYWIREHKGHLYFAAVDCTGHGVPGAFMSMLGISQLNEIMNTDELLTPATIMTELRQRVVRELSGSTSEQTAKDGMDAAMVRMPCGISDPPADPEEVEIQFSGAQNPLYVIREGIGEASKDTIDLSDVPEDRIRAFKKSPDGIEIKGDPMPVGHDGHAFDAFTNLTLKAQKGDMLYMFSDGYADQFGGPKGKKFRYGPFKKLLADLHKKPVDEQKKELDRIFEDWKVEGHQEQIDDVVVIGVRL